MARAIRAQIAHRRALRLPGRLFGAFRRYKRRARTSRGCAPQRASQGEGRRPSPYVIPTPGWHGLFGRTPVRSVVNRQAAPAPGLRAQPVFTQRPPHYLRRSRLKFFAEAFFQKSRSTACICAVPALLFAAQPIKVFWLTFFSKKVSFKKAGTAFVR